MALALTLDLLALEPVFFFFLLPFAWPEVSALLTVFSDFLAFGLLVFTALEGDVAVALGSELWTGTLVPSTLRVWHLRKFLRVVKILERILLTDSRISEWTFSQDRAVNSSDD